MTDPRIEAAAIALYGDVNRQHATTKGWDEVKPRWQESYRRNARAALAAADNAATITERDDWANYIETWEGTVGGPVCNPQSIVAALRAKGTPFGVAANDRGTE